MEDHGAGCHPLLHGAHLQPAHAALAYGAWDPASLAAFDASGGGEQQPLEECFATASELRDALLRALAELDAARDAHQADLRRVESEAARLVASAAAERDELRRHCHSLLLLLHHHTAQPPTQSIPDPPPLHVGGVLGGGAGCGMDEHVVTVVSSTEEEEDAELEMALARRLPEKGRLVEAVVSAGPLLQTLLLAGPLPRWRHPPPPDSADVIPPFNPCRQSPTDAANYSFSSASSSSPESNCSGAGGGGVQPVATVQQQQQQQQHALPSCFHMMNSSFCM